MQIVNTQHQSHQLSIKSILLIDDNDIDNYISSHLIQKTGFTGEVILKSSAEEGLNYLQSGIEGNVPLPEIIFLDIRMPAMDGFEFLQEFAKLNPIAENNCSIYMLSSSIDKRDIEQAKKNPNVADFITKPLNIDKLNTVLSAWENQQTELFKQSA
ncbi:MAG: response regulator [Bacteroidia bacterium]|nr:response regulator [Bacteroidia bacterium]